MRAFTWGVVKLAYADNGNCSNMSAIKAKCHSRFTGMASKYDKNYVCYMFGNSGRPTSREGQGTAASISINATTKNQNAFLYLIASGIDFFACPLPIVINTM